MHRLDPSIWLGTEIVDWSAFLKLIADALDPRNRPRTLLFRGQSRGWTLRPTLLRALPASVAAEAALRAESDALEHFRSQAHLHDSGQLSQFASTSSLLSWWAWMQHHAAPTRLLDWTASPYVAAYFAAEKDPDDDGVVLVINADRCEEYWRPYRSERAFTESYLDAAAATPALAAFTLPRKTYRLVAQQGYFTVSTSVLHSHDQLLATAGAAVRRWVLPARLKSGFLQQLRVMNVGANSLFPGLDGLGRSAAEIVRTAN